MSDFCIVPTLGGQPLGETFSASSTAVGDKNVEAVTTGDESVFLSTNDATQVEGMVEDGLVSYAHRDSCKAIVSAANDGRLDAQSLMKAPKITGIKRR